LLPEGYNAAQQRVKGGGRRDRVPLETHVGLRHRCSSRALLGFDIIPDQQAFLKGVGEPALKGGVNPLSGRADDAPFEKTGRAQGEPAHPSPPRRPQVPGRTPAPVRFQGSFLPQSTMHALSFSTAAQSVQATKATGAKVTARCHVPSNVGAFYIRTRPPRPGRLREGRRQCVGRSPIDFVPMGPRWGNSWTP